jgi:hypothetical protein
MGPRLPAIVNSDGDEIAFHTVRYAFLPGTTAEAVRERLRTAASFREESETFWSWVEAKAPPTRPRGSRQGAKSVTGKGQTYSVTLDDGATVLGNMESPAMPLRSRPTRGRGRSADRRCSPRSWEGWCAPRSRRSRRSSR